MDAVQNAFQVHVPVLHAVFCQQRKRHQTSIVYPNVDSAIGIQCLFCKGFIVCHLGNIRHLINRIAAAGLNIGHDLLQLFFPARSQNHLVALLCQQTGSSFTDTAGCASNDDNFCVAHKIPLSDFEKLCSLKV